MKRKQFGVIGLGRFGSAMALTLTELGHDVIGVDGDEARVQQLADVITHALQIDATDEKALRSAGIHEVEVAVVSIVTPRGGETCDRCPMRSARERSASSRSVGGFSGNFKELLQRSRVADLHPQT